MTYAIFKVCDYKGGELSSSTNLSKEVFIRKLSTFFENEDFENEVFNTQNLMFQTLLQKNNIPVIFFDFNVFHTYIDVLNTNIINVYEITNDSSFFLKNDMFHFNQKGHEYIAEKLYNFINKNNTK